MPTHVSGRKFRIALIIVFCLAVFATVALPPRSRAKREVLQVAAQKSKHSRPTYVPGDVLVRYKNESAAKKRSRTTETLNGLNGQSMPVRIERLAGSDIVEGLRIARVAPTDTEEAIAALKQQPDVLYAEPNYILHTDLDSNDPRFMAGDQYGLGKIGAPTAWNTNQGSNSVVLGVIDQGIFITHPDLQANVWVNPAPGAVPGFTGDINGYNFVDNNGTVWGGDVNEDHASHVAGIAGAVGNNGVGVSGVNWRVKLMSLRFLDEAGGGSTADAIRACGYAKSQRDLFVSSGGTQGANLRVLNNSYGGGGFSQAFLDAINNLNTSGILFVAAGGNFPEDPERDNDIVPHYPSGYNAPNVIGVANTTSSDALSSGSHFGANSVHLGAPGTGILSTTPGAGVLAYQFFSGTSMATPHVSGAAALLLAQNPNLTVQQLKNLLLLNGDVVPDLVDRTVTGRRLNVGKSFAAMAENDVTPPGTVTNLHINTQNGRNINVGWNASGDDGAAGQAALYQLTFTDSKTGAVIPLKNVVPATTGAGQAADVKTPYRHTAGTIKVREFDNVGNEGTTASIPVNVSFNEGDPYATTLNIPVALSTGGGRLFGGPQDDDRYLDFLMPFSFPYFGTNYTSLTISTNGNLYFSTPPTRPNGDADDAFSSSTDFVKFKMISGLWDDIDLRSTSRADAGVYVVQTANQVIFRWQGVPCNDNGSGCTGGAPINFEIELNSDGTIKSRYGSGNTGIFPLVGISGGEPEAYIIPSHTSENTSTNLTNAVEVTYIPRNVINPLDNKNFFVSQQYRDFLGREPDLPGLGFWSGQINCAVGDTTCLINRRVGVSAAFFVENEFQRTGSFVYRSYKGGLGRRPTYAEFSADRPLIVEGPTLEQTKQAYALAFVQRAEFVNKYAGQDTAAAFADALIGSIQTNSGVNLTPSRTAIINAYNAGVGQTQQRAFAMRAAIDDPLFTNAELNAAFVTMQYFGYLARDPELGGFLFWLNVLNQPGNSFRGMVCAFITSAEYQRRFSSLVPHTDVECGFLAP